MPVTGVVEKLDINGWPVHYEKFGTGPEVLLLIPGSIGTGRTDFSQQIEGPHAFDLRKYTLICIELPGWGRSRPPQREYGPNIYLNDAFCAMKIMDSLGHKFYSIIGWSEGARTALVMASKAPAIVKSVVVIAIFLKVNKQTLAPLMSTQNVKNWPQELTNKFKKIYGDELQKMWDGFVEASNLFKTDFARGLTSNDLKSIRCPVLVFHGDQDPLVGLEQALYTISQVPDSHLHRFKDGLHNCHENYAKDFLRITEDFFRDVN